MIAGAANIGHSLVGRAQHMMHFWGIRPRRKKLMAPERPYEQVKRDGQRQDTRKRGR